MNEMKESILIQNGYRIRPAILYRVFNTVLIFYQGETLTITVIKSMSYTIDLVSTVSTVFNSSPYR